MTRCPHCPLPPAAACRGQENPIWCRHMDPSDPIYDPSYARILERDDVQVELVPAHDLAAVDRAYAEHGTGPARTPCCS